MIKNARDVDKSRSVPSGEIPKDGYSVLELLKRRMWGSPDDLAWRYFEVYYKYVSKTKASDKINPNLSEEQLKDLELDAAEAINNIPNQIPQDESPEPTDPASDFP